MISVSIDSGDIEMVPQAIFGRKLRFFTLQGKSSYDDLDKFSGAFFTFNNEFQFALRHYQQHPEFTTTLYLEFEITSTDLIILIVNKITAVFELPSSAVLWKRGDPFDFGVLPVTTDRLLEPEARYLVLKIAAQQPNHEASTTFIKGQIKNYKRLSYQDLEPSPSRRKEQKWQQIVGNVKVHHTQKSSIFSLGYAEIIKDGIRVTRAGLDRLEEMGFFVPRAYSLA